MYDGRIEWREGAKNKGTAARNDGESEVVEGERVCV